LQLAPPYAIRRPAEGSARIDGEKYVRPTSGVRLRHVLEEPLTTRHVTIDDRDFLIQVLRLANGRFVTVSEGAKNRIGGLILSLRTGERATTSTLIPGKFGGIFASMIAELVAARTNGIAIVSLYLVSDLPTTATRQLFGEVEQLLGTT
jgi:hypothetical protein